MRPLRPRPRHPPHVTARRADDVLRLPPSPADLTKEREAGQDVKRCDGRSAGTPPPTGARKREGGGRVVAPPGTRTPESLRPPTLAAVHDDRDRGTHTDSLRV